MNKIDVVLTWVDSNDQNWISERNKFSEETDGSSINRFRDWGTLQYIFRGIDNFMPWVNKVYFVTWGHLPAWLNLDYSKLIIVRHEDYIPSKYLPTFNSNVLDLNMFRIHGLSEQYINFNDDTFVIKPTKAEDFFFNGKPKDMACISPQPIRRDSITNVEINNLQIINSYFTTGDIKRNWKKWINIKKYGRYTLRTVLFLQFQTIIGIFEPHIPISHLKTVCSELWDIEYEAYDSTCTHRFRSKLDVNDWLSRQWQLLSGDFVPREANFGKLIRVTEKEAIHEAISSSNYKIICINDNLQDDSAFDEYKDYMCNELDQILPKKSAFEI